MTSIFIIITLLGFFICYDEFCSETRLRKLHLEKLERQRAPSRTYQDHRHSPIPRGVRASLQGYRLEHVICVLEVQPGAGRQSLFCFTIFVQLMAEGPNTDRVIIQSANTHK